MPLQFKTLVAFCMAAASFSAASAYEADPSDGHSECSVAHVNYTKPAYLWYCNTNGMRGSSYLIFDEKHEKACYAPCDTDAPQDMTVSGFFPDQDQSGIPNVSFPLRDLGYSFVSFGHVATGIRAQVDQSFTTAEAEKLRKAYKVFLYRALKPETLDCAFNRAVHEMPLGNSKEQQRDYFRIQMIYALSPKNIGGDYPINQPAILAIKRYETVPSNGGSAYVDHYDPLATPNPSAKHFPINMNANSYAMMQNDIERLAGIIAHEVLHTFGYEHKHFDTTGERNSFIYAYGDCIGETRNFSQTPDFQSGVQEYDFE